MRQRSDAGGALRAIRRKGAGDCSIAQDRSEKGGVGKSRAIRALAADDQLLPLMEIAEML